MSHKIRFELTAPQCCSRRRACWPPAAPSTGTRRPAEQSGGVDGASHPEWSQYTFTIGDNGGDGSEELSKVTGAFDDAPYKIKFARFDYGPPLVQAAAAGDIDLGYVGTVPPITGAAQQYGFKIVATQHGADATKAAENIIVPKDSPIQTLADLKGKKIAIPQGSSAHGLALLALKSVGPDPEGRRARLPQPGSRRHGVQHRQGGRLVDLEPAVGDRGRRTAPASSPRAFRRSTRSTTTTWRPTSRSTTRPGGPPWPTC